MNQDYQRIKELIEKADAIVIGARSGLSTAAGFNYGGKRFMNHFKYMHDLYGYNGMYSAGFHLFDTLEDYWVYWSKFVYINRYQEKALPLYQKLLELVKDKNHFVLTTNVEHQFQLAGFSKERLFYTQGDYGLFQCNEPCHNKTYDNEKQIIEMVNSIKDNKIPSSLIPKCPKCGKPMSMNLRCDDSFVEDEGWKEASKRYTNFIQENMNKKVVYLELGVGYNTPIIIKYPFWKYTKANKDATYISISLDDHKYNDYSFPKGIINQSLLIKKDIMNLSNRYC